MKAVGEHSIASLLHTILEVSWWLVAAALVLLTALLIYGSCADLSGGNLTMDLPVALVLEAPVHSNVADAQLGRVQGNLRFPVQNGPFFLSTSLVILLLCGGLLWLVTQLREIFRSLSRGVLFSRGNAQRIRWVGLTILCGEVLRAALVLYCSYYTSQNFTADGLRFVAAADWNGITIMAGLAILVIAEVFREGTRLTEEQSLTI